MGIIGLQTQLPCFQKLVLHHTATAELSKKSGGLAFQAGPEFIRVLPGTGLIA